ncbi:MAG: PulJ/GspJ family protein [Thermodesulfovibrionales bacterium]
MKRMVSGRSGFTLIELLISLAMLSIILGALYSTFFLSHKAITGVDESLLKLQEMRMFLDTISREIDSLPADMNKFSVLKIEDRDIYGKQASRINFTSFSPMRPGLSLITYYIEDRAGSKTLFKKTVSAYTKEKVESNETNTAEMIEGIESFTIEVSNSDKTWLRTWDTAETKRTPLEIRVSISAMIKDRPVSMYETIRPRIGKPL